MLIKLLPVIFSLLVSPIHAEQFQAPVTDTRWQVIESPLECSLAQEIAGYGEAQFHQHTGGELTLRFSTKTFPATQNNVHFEVAEAPWQNSEQRLHLISIPTADNQTQFELTGALAKQALTQIQEGRFPTLRYQSKNANEEISVLLSTVHLSDSMPAFQQCIDTLHPDTYEDIRKLTIHFAIESSELTLDAQVALTRLADYVKVDNSVKRINIAGYTDDHGRKKLNIPLSEARSITIKNFLVQQCDVPENLITTSFHREFNPIASNKTAAGRALNRRTEIEVLR